MTPFDISLIKPQTHGISDKYSWNLYTYLKKNKGEHRILLSPKDTTFHPMNMLVLQGTIGKHLWAIMGEGKATRYDFSLYDLKSYTDITEEFWEHYVAKGRCVFDKEHGGWWVGGDQRFTMIDTDTKVCQWCNATLRRTEETVTRTVERWEVQQ